MHDAINAVKELTEGKPPESYPKHLSIASICLTCWIELRYGNLANEIIPTFRARDNGDAP